MNKQEFKTLLDKYQEAQDIVTTLDAEFGICMWNSNKENFYNKYNWCIFKLLEYCFGEDNCELIENYLFEETDITFDQLCESLEIYD